MAELVELADGIAELVRDGDTPAAHGGYAGVKVATVSPTNTARGCSESSALYRLLEAAISPTAPAPTTPPAISATPTPGGLFQDRHLSVSSRWRQRGNRSWETPVVAFDQVNVVWRNQRGELP